MSAKSIALFALAGSSAVVSEAKVWQDATLGRYSNLMGVAAIGPNEAHYAMTDTKVGQGVIVTTDYGVSSTYYGPAGKMNMDIAFTADRKTTVMVGLGGIFVGAPYSGNYTEAEGIKVVSQSVEGFSSQSFGVTGQFSFADKSSVNGVLASVDAGATWQKYDVGAISDPLMAARYASFPSEKVWYVSCGSWLYANPAPNAEAKQLTSRISMKADGSIAFFTQPEPPTGYAGGIYKTTDGGANFKLVFRTDQMYFNQIHCYDEMHCMAVGENTDAAFVKSTSDGGATWTNIYTGPQYMSLCAVRMLSPSEIWVGGGIMNPKSVEGHYLHSVDGGATWEVSTLDGQVFDFSFSEGFGYASYMTPSTTGAAVYK